MIIYGKEMRLEDLMHRRNSDYVWVAYSKEYPYLPIAIASSAEELAKIVGVQTVTVVSLWNKFVHGKTKRTRYARVLIGE